MALDITSFAKNLLSKSLKKNDRKKPRNRYKKLFALLLTLAFIKIILTRPIKKKIIKDNAKNISCPLGIYALAFREKPTSCKIIIARMNNPF
jgi:hypothetical protein